MSLIDEKEGLATQYVRCRAVIIANELAQKPTIGFSEEIITKINGKVDSVRTIDGFTVEFDPNETIQLVDPITGQELGKAISQGEIYLMIYSAWRHQRTKRASDATLAQ